MCWPSARAVIIFNNGAKSTPTKTDLEYVAPEPLRPASKHTKHSRMCFLCLWAEPCLIHASKHTFQAHPANHPLKTYPAKHNFGVNMGVGEKAIDEYQAWKQKGHSRKEPFFLQQLPAPWPPRAWRPQLMRRLLHRPRPGPGQLGDFFEDSVKVHPSASIPGVSACKAQ